MFQIQRLTKKSQALALKVPLRLISEIIQYFSTYLLPGTKVQSIDGEKEYKRIFLIPELSPEVQTWLKEHQIEKNAQEVVLHANDISYFEILRELLPKEIEVPTGFEQVGHIVHFNLKPEHQPYHQIIGEAILFKYKNIKSVVNKEEKLDNTFRTPILSLMAGDPSYLTTVKEGDCRFTFDFSTVYWCTRLITERNKMLDHLDQTDILIDMFCGVGPLSLRAGKKGVKVIANDLNPECFKYLKQNIINNNLTKQVIPLNQDANQLIELILNQDKRKEHGINYLFTGFNHVYMNLPVLNIQFLHLFKGIKNRGYSNQGPLFIHLTSFCKADDISEVWPELEQRIGEELDFFNKNSVIDLHLIKKITPKKIMISLSFQIDEKDLLGVLDLPQKKIKI